MLLTTGPTTVLMDRLKSDDHEVFQMYCLGTVFDFRRYGSVRVMYIYEKRGSFYEPLFSGSRGSRTPDPLLVRQML